MKLFTKSIRGAFRSPHLSLRRPLVTWSASSTPTRPSLSLSPSYIHPLSSSSFLPFAKLKLFSPALHQITTKSRCSDRPAGKDAIPIDVVVYFVTEEQMQLQAQSIDMSTLVGLLPPLDSIVTSSVLHDFNGHKKAAVMLYTTPTVESYIPRVLLVGLGKEQYITRATLRSATYAMIQALKSAHIDNALVDLSHWSKAISAAEAARVMARISLLSLHSFSRKMASDANNTTLASLSILLPESQSGSKHRDELEEAMRHEAIIADCTLYNREIVNERANIATPSFYEKEATSLAGVYSLPIHTIKEEALLKEGYRLSHAVGQGAKEGEGARIIAIEYIGDTSSNEGKICLVGKGVTFDTGGLNLKATGRIETMYLDCAGSTTVLSTMRALALLKPQNINVVGVMAFADNSVDSHSIKPHSIIQSASSKGFTVLVSNTDAEGRLLLADALVYAQRHYRPETIVDLATLTGACITALGEHVAGLFSNDDALAAELLESGLATQEILWRLPILTEHRRGITGTESDLNSQSKNKGGEACVAAAFLQKFVDEGVRWCHLDIAPTAMASYQREWVPKNGTGFGTQLLVDWLLRQAKAHGRTNAARDSTFYQ